MFAHSTVDDAVSNPAFLVAMFATVAVGAVLGFRWLLRRTPPAEGARRPAWLKFGIPALLVVVVGVGAATSDQWLWLLEDGDVQSEGVSAPTLTVASGETLFRIGAGSTVSYEVEERLAGTSKTASGSTTLVAGDIALDLDDPTEARIGTVVVNVEAFASDSALRDKRIRHDYLESTEFPYAEFTPTLIEGIPAAADEHVDVALTIGGDLTVKQTTAPATFTGTARLEGDTLTASVTSTVKMSDYDIGPIAISGLVSTGDDVTLTFDLHAVETDPDEPSVLAAPGPDAAEAGAAVDGISFADDVQPILERNCASCHTDEGIGEETFTLATAGDASEVAPDLALVTQARYMPPWPASDLSADFLHDWSLTTEEIEAVAAWAAAKGPLDVPADTPLEAEATTVREIERDHVLAGEAYTGTEAYPDDYRCQIIDIPTGVDTTQWLKSFTFEPDQTEIVHHAVISLVEAEARDKADALDAADPAAGWRCFFSGSLGAGSQIAAWAPGQQPVEYPEGVGIPVQPGDFLVVQIHYHYDHDFPADRSAMVLDLASDAEIVAAGGALTPVTYRVYVAPAEIPCTPEEEGPLCDRDAVIEQIREKYGLADSLIGDGLLASCGSSLEEALADTDGTADGSCDRRVSNPGTIVGIFGHMHEFGESFRMTLNPGTPEERILLDIPSWSFDWQFDYRPSEQIVLDRDDVLRIECTWRRDLAPMPEPRHITWNEGTEDEMCYSAVATTPAP